MHSTALTQHWRKNNAVNVHLRHAHAFFFDAAVDGRGTRRRGPAQAGCCVTEPQSARGSAYPGLRSSLVVHAIWHRHLSRGTQICFEQRFQGGERHVIDTQDGCLLIVVLSLGAQTKGLIFETEACARAHTGVILLAANMPGCRHTACVAGRCAWPPFAKHTKPLDSLREETAHQLVLWHRHKLLPGADGPPGSHHALPWLEAAVDP